MQQRVGLKCRCGLITYDAGQRNEQSGETPLTGKQIKDEIRPPYPSSMGTPEKRKEKERNPLATESKRVVRAMSKDLSKCDGGQGYR